MRSLALWQRVTMSSLALLSKCQYWAREDVERPAREATAAGEKGTDLHAYAESIIRGTHYDCDSFDPGDLQKARHIKAWLETNIIKSASVQVMPEVPIAWDPVTSQAHALLSDGQRDYSSAGATWLCGTADCIVVTPLSVTVYDWKFGRIDSAAAQLEMLAVTAAKLYDKPFASYCIVQVSEEGVQTVWGKVEQEIELVEDATRLRLNLIKDAAPQPGGHCAGKYCPALAYCPAAEKAVADIEPVPGPFKFTMHVSSDAHAEWMRQNIDMGKKYLAAVEENVKSYARERGGLPLPSGLVWREIEAPRTSTNVGLLKKLARDKGATDEEVEGCNKTYRSKYFREVKP